MKNHLIGFDFWTYIWIKLYNSLNLIQVPPKSMPICMRKELWKSGSFLRFTLWNSGILYATWAMLLLLLRGCALVGYFSPVCCNHFKLHLPLRRSVISVLIPLFPQNYLSTWKNSLGKCSWTLLIPILQAQASLNSGVNLRQVVKLPPDEDFNDWLAVHVVDFFNR